MFVAQSHLLGFVFVPIVIDVAFFGVGQDQDQRMQALVLSCVVLLTSLVSLGHHINNTEEQYEEMVKFKNGKRRPTKMMMMIMMMMMRIIIRRRRRRRT